MIHAARLALVTFVLAAGVSPAHAQGRQDVPGRSGAEEPVVSPAEIQRMLDGYMLIQAQDMLDLTDEQFPRFVTIMRELQDTRRRTSLERVRMLQDLRRMTSGRGRAPDEAAIKEQLRTLEALDERSTSLIRQQQVALDKVLTTVQQARYRVFEEMMEQRKLELLMRARQTSRGRQ